MKNRANPLLELNGASVELLVEDALRPVLRSLDLHVARGEILGVVGESGSGKSMIARTILQTLPQGARFSGSVRMNGEEVSSLSKQALREVRGKRIGMIFQDPRAFVNPLWRAGDYVAEPLAVHCSLSRRAARKRSLELLSDVGIVEPDRVFAAYPHELSGGMLQRVGIAGALATDPELLIADEPTTALDVTVQAEIMAIVRELSRERGMATVFISHDLDLATMVCDRIYVLYGGSMMCEQPTADLLAHPAHPYARALLDARPRIDRRLPRLETIPGQPSGAADAPAGCPFHPRCEFADDRCRSAVLKSAEVESRSLTTCVRIQAGDLPIEKVEHAGIS